MRSGEEKLKQFIETHRIQAEHLSFAHLCHSVADAAETAGMEPENFVKNICLTDAQGTISPQILLQANGGKVVWIRT